MSTLHAYTFPCTQSWQTLPIICFFRLAKCPSFATCLYTLPSVILFTSSSVFPTVFPSFTRSPLLFSPPLPPSTSPLSMFFFRHRLSPDQKTNTSKQRIVGPTDCRNTFRLLISRLGANDNTSWLWSAILCSEASLAIQFREIKAELCSIALINYNTYSLLCFSFFIYFFWF